MGLAEAIATNEANRSNDAILIGDEYDILLILGSDDDDDGSVNGCGDVAMKE